MRVLKKAIIYASILVLVLVVASLVTLPLLSQAHTQTTTTSIGIANLDVYLNFSDGTSQHLSSSAPITLNLQGKTLIAVTAIASDIINASITNQTISVGATDAGQPLTTYRTGSSPNRYEISSFTPGILSIWESVSALSSGKVYIANVPPVNVSITTTQSSTTSQTMKTTQSSTISQTQTTETQTSTYPYGLQETITSAYPITWTLLTCVAAESLYGVGSCQHLYATYSPGVPVTTVSWSTSTGEVVSINGQICQQIGTNGQTNSCFSTFSIGSGTFATCTSGCTVYSQDGFYP